VLFDSRNHRGTPRAILTQNNLRVTKHLGTELLATRPFAQDFVTVLPRRYIDRHEIARHRHLVEADTMNAGDFRVEPGVVVAEETHPWASAGNGLGEGFSVAPVPAADGAIDVSPLELDAGGRIVKEKHVNTSMAAQLFALVMGKVTLGPSLQITSSTLVVGWRFRARPKRWRQLLPRSIVP
jgi:hypothetical protein